MNRTLSPLGSDISVLAQGFHALSDPTRLQIIAMLRYGERCVCELTEALEAGQSRLSFHLKTLKDAGLVQDRRDGRWSYYSLVHGALEELQEQLEALGKDSLSRKAAARCC